MTAEPSPSRAAFLAPDATDEEIDAFAAILGQAPPVLFTLGYAGLRGADDLRRILRGTGVATVVDVRLRPWGRAPFNGLTASRLLVESVGPAYRWDQRLGNLAYRTGGVQIKNIEAVQDVLDELRSGRSVALMCVCPDPRECHRWTLAEEAVRRTPGLRVVHL